MIKRVIKRLLFAVIDSSFLDSAKISHTILLDAIKYAAPKYAHGKLVDLGCGTKPYAKEFEPFISSYFGVDHPDAARCHYGLNTAADLWADCTETGLVEEMFDTVLSTEVLEHMKDPNKLLREGYRLLKRNGYLILTTPFLVPLHGEPYDYYRYTIYSLEDLLSSSGFKVTEIVPLGNYGITSAYLKLTNICRGNSPPALFVYLRILAINMLFYWFRRKPDIHSYNDSSFPLHYLVIAQK